MARDPSRNEHAAPSIRQLTGSDEYALAGGEPVEAVRLLGRLLPEGALDRMSLSEIDRALAALHLSLYGAKADCRARCPACGEGFEFSVDLIDVQTAQDAERPGPPDADGAWTLEDGRRVRAPRLSDLGGDGALSDRLLVDGEPGGDGQAVEALLERAAPVLALDLATRCPHCETEGEARFDIAAYLARRLAGERPFLVRETHLIASRYGWPHDQILALNREDRRAYAGLIEAERANAQRRWSA